MGKSRCKMCTIFFSQNKTEHIYKRRTVVQIFANGCNAQRPQQAAGLSSNSANLLLQPPRIAEYKRYVEILSLCSEYIQRKGAYDNARKNLSHGAKRPKFLPKKLQNKITCLSDHSCCCQW